jgi:DNA-binding transcriptional regulator YiaG
MKKSKVLANVAAARRVAGISQLEFWSRFGVTQSCGSRYESGRNIPTPLKFLLRLYEIGRISDKDLADIRKGLSSKK